MRHKPLVTVRSQLGVGRDAAAGGPRGLLLDQITRDACEYYAGKGESPGWWLGSLAEHSGLQGEASEEAVHRLSRDYELLPTTSEAVIQLAMIQLLVLRLASK